MNRLAQMAAVAFGWGACLGAVGLAAGREADLVLTNGKVMTMDEKGTVASAVAVKDGKIVRVGNGQEAGDLVGASTRQIDLGGKTVVPGLIDAHCHPTVTLSILSKGVDGRFPGVKSVRQAMENLAARAKQTPKGEWIFLVGSSASQEKYVEKRLPTKQEMDQAAPDNPVWFMNGTHEEVLNSMGLERIGVSKQSLQPKGGGVVVVDANGEPTGAIFEGEGNAPDIVTKEELAGYFEKGIPELWSSYGYTTINGIIQVMEMKVLNGVAATGLRPTIRYTTATYASANGQGLKPELAKVEPTEANAEWFRTGALKAWIDGENDARSGLLGEPYVGYDPKHPRPTDFGTGKGLQVMTQEQADALAKLANEGGMICMFHASGDRAMDVALNAYEKRVKAGGPRTIMRIEHFGIFAMSEEQLKRAKDLGIDICIQPAWLNFLGKANYEQLGPQRASTGFRYKTMVDAGMKPAGGTDNTGVYPQAIDPFLHMWAAVTRTSDMGVIAPEQAMSVDDALKMWTIWAARSLGQQDIKGSIEPGKLADMVVLSEDLYSIPPERIKEVKPAMTILGGKVVYEAK